MPCLLRGAAQRLIAGAPGTQRTRREVESFYLSAYAPGSVTHAVTGGAVATIYQDRRYRRLQQPTRRHRTGRPLLLGLARVVYLADAVTWRRW